MADEAVECALRALRRRERSVLEVEEHLRTHGFSGDDCARTIETLVRTGLVSDERFARARASSLAGRGAGDARIRHELAEAGVSLGLVEDALVGVEPEAARARRIVARRGASDKTARYLRGQGFSGEVVSAVVAECLDGELR